MISDDSGYGNFIEISDDSSYNSNRKKRRMNLPDEELHFNHLIHNNQASCSSSSLRKAHNPHHDILLGASRHSEGHAFRNLLSQSMVPLASSQDPSHKDGGQRIPLPGCQVQEFLRRNETDEPLLVNQCDSENVSMTIDDSAAGGGNHEMCQKVTEVTALLAFSLSVFLTLICRYILLGCIALITHLNADPGEQLGVCYFQ